MKFIYIIALICLCYSANSQTDSIFVQGTYRTFILHLPDGYNENVDYPLVFNMHGLGSNAFEQQLYSQFDVIADIEDFIVVYPDAVNNSWDLFGTTDLNFISNLADTIRSRYSTNDCLFFMGMSQGGFISYKFACEFPEHPTAIAVVTGNMTIPLQNSCDAQGGTPVMHFHGTEDQLVIYNGSFGIPPVEEAIQWWADADGCNPDPDITAIPDINTNDGSTVEKYYYNECSDHHEVILYKVTGGGHTWPGAFPIQSFGNTNQDINASELIGDFFSLHCDLSTFINSIAETDFTVYPNPAENLIHIEGPTKEFLISVFNLQGQKVGVTQTFIGTTTIDCQNFPAGIYWIQMTLNEKLVYHKKIIVQHH